MTALGVNCSTTRAFLAVADDGEIQPGHPEYVDAPNLADSSDAVMSVLDEVGRVMDEVGADRVGLLKPEGGPVPKKPHSAFVPRITLEALVRVAAGTARREIEVLPRPTVRSRLDLPMGGKLVEHVDQRIPTKVGSNWSEERQLAALAALAVGVST